MKNYVLVTFFIAITSAANAAEYQSDWDYKNFYEAINTCRSAVVYPAALGYEAKGLSSRQTKETLRNEMIAITPVSESIASEVCYCAVNAYAKDKSNADFIKNGESVADYFEAPLCKEKIASAIKLMPQNAKSLRFNSQNGGQVLQLSSDRLNQTSGVKLTDIRATNSGSSSLPQQTAFRRSTHHSLVITD